MLLSQGVAATLLIFDLSAKSGRPTLRTLFCMWPSNSEISHFPVHRGKSPQYMSTIFKCSGFRTFIGGIDISPFWEIIVNNIYQDHSVSSSWFPSDDIVFLETSSSKRRGWSNLTVVYSQTFHLNGFTQTPDSEPSCFAKLIRIGIVILLFSIYRFLILISAIHKDIWCFQFGIRVNHTVLCFRKSEKKTHQGWFCIVSHYFIGFFFKAPSKQVVVGHGISWFLNHQTTVNGETDRTEAFNLPMHCRKRGGNG